MSRNETTYHLVLGAREDGEIVILDDTFEYSDGFRGATGSILYPVSQEMLDEALTGDSKEEYYEEIWRQEASSTNGTTDGLSDWVTTIDDEEYLESRFETYSDLEVGEIAEALGMEEPARYEVVGCGRIFLGALRDITLVDSDEVRAAVKSIKEYEAKR